MRGGIGCEDSDGFDLEYWVFSSKEASMVVIAAGDGGTAGILIMFGFIAGVVGLLVIAAVIDLRRHLREIAHKNHLCTACGYDLRVGHNQCPECGCQVSASPPHSP